MTTTHRPVRADESPRARRVPPLFKVLAFIGACVVLAALGSDTARQVGTVIAPVAATLIMYTVLAYALFGSPAGARAPRVVVAAHNRWRLEGTPAAVEAGAPSQSLLGSAVLFALSWAYLTMLLTSRLFVGAWSVVVRFRDWLLAAAIPFALAPSVALSLRDVAPLGVLATVLSGLAALFALAVLGAHAYRPVAPLAEVREALLERRLPTFGALAVPALWVAGLGALITGVTGESGTGNLGLEHKIGVVLTLVGVAVAVLALLLVARTRTQVDVEDDVETPEPFDTDETDEIDMAADEAEASAPQERAFFDKPATKAAKPDVEESVPTAAAWSPTVTPTRQ